MGDTIDHDVTKKNYTQEKKKLIMPKGYEIAGEVDIDKIQSALETYADRVSLAR
jgi:hypothetical protein